MKASELIKSVKQVFEEAPNWEHNLSANGHALSIDLENCKRLGEALNQALAEVKKQEAANERLKAFIEDWPDGHTPGCLMNLERTSEEQPEPYCDCGYEVENQRLKEEILSEYLRGWREGVKAIRKIIQDANNKAQRIIT